MAAVLFLIVIGLLIALSLIGIGILAGREMEKYERNHKIQFGMDSDSDVLSVDHSDLLHSDVGDDLK